MAELRPGTVVYGNNENDIYSVVRYIGGGNFGRVYEVKSRANGEAFALKTIDDTSFMDSTERRALLNEGQLALGIEHPNVVRIFYFHNGERYANLPPYILMEFVAGGNLQRVLDERKSSGFFSLSEMANIFVQLAMGMQAINARLVHRDIKPDNILIENGIYKISDFGLSKVVGAATRGQSQTFKGINHIMYVAPEASRLEQNLPLMDMYSMGIVFFQIATLAFPYRVNPGADVFEAWRQAHLFQQPLDPTGLNPDIDAEISQMILKMIAKRPNDRYQSWDEVLQRLQHIKSASPANVQNIAALLRRDQESRRNAEREELETQKKTRVQEENEGFIEYSFNQLLQAATQIVESFNRSSEFTKLRVDKTGRFAFSIKRDETGTTGVIEIQTEVPHNLPQFQVGGFSNLPTIKAWGIIKAPSRYGFNLVLVSSGQDDLYGEWRVLYKTMTYPHVGNLQNPKTTPFELTELPSQANRVASGGFRSDKAIFNADLLIPLLEELL